MRKLLLTLAIIMLPFSSAKAGFLIEPYLGYIVSGEAGQATKTDVSGTTFGARVGYSFLGLAVGLDYGMGTLEPDTGSDADFNSQVVFVKYTFPVLFSVYAGMQVGGAIESASGGSDVEGAGGTKIGFGYSGFPLISINLEMWKYTYDEVGAATLNPEYELNATMLSISLPL